MIFIQLGNVEGKVVDPRMIKESSTEAANKLMSKNPVALDEPHIHIHVQHEPSSPINQTPKHERSVSSKPKKPSSMHCIDLQPQILHTN